MYTVCPKCALTLAVSAEDLRKGQGYVRCGRCSNVFNALLTLTESTDTGSPGTRSPLPPPPAEVLAVQAPALAEETPSQAVRLAPELAVHDLDFNEDPPAAENGTETHEYRHTGTFETIVLEGDAITQTEEMVPEESVDSQIAEIAQQIAMATSDEVVIPADEPTAEGVTEDPVAALAPPEAASGHVLAWSLGAIVLLLLLGAQAVHHWRNDLAALPALNAPLSKAYATLGMKLMPRWDLGAYEIVQLGAESNAATGAAINVRLSITNRAARAQPAPFVRLTLLDRYGKRLAARDLAPQEYLKTPLPRGFLGAGERADSQVSVLDPGPQASSFELDVCLPEVSGSLRCANDRPAGKPR